MATGTVKFFNTQKAFGFIQPTDGSKDGNCSGAHDRSPAHCRISFNRRVLEKFPAATAETGSAEKTTPGVPDAGRGLGFGSIDPDAGQAACRFPAASLPRSVITS